jgi:ketosteroid isomerase-like protein
VVTRVFGLLTLKEPAMNNPNIAFVKSLYQAFQQDRIQSIVDALAPNVDWQTVGRSKDYPTFGPRQGRAAVEEFFSTIADNETFSEFTPREFFCDSDRVFVFGRYAGTIRKTGRRFETEWVHVFTIRDGQVTRFREHTDTAQFAEGYRA